MQKITVSAPGKLMLLGEHAVVYNHPCLVTAVDQRMWATVEILQTSDFKLEAPDVSVLNYKKSIFDLGKGDIPKGAQFVEIAVKNVFEFIQRHPELDSGSIKKMPKQVRHDKYIGIKVTTKSEFSSLFGFGSSSASTVCIIKALSELFTLKLSNKEIFDLAYKTVLDIQGKGSGFDVAAGVYGGTLCFITGGKVIEPLKIDLLPLIVGYSGIKADTVTVINKVKEKFDNNQKRLDEICSEIEIIVEKAKKVLVEKNWETLGSLMNTNQQYLVELGVSIPKLDEMIESSLNAGAYGAKLSGAGGGDCMVALSSDEKRKTVENAIRQVGGEVIQVKTNAEGVRIEL